MNKVPTHTLVAPPAVIARLYDDHRAVNKLLRRLSSDVDAVIQGNRQALSGIADALREVATRQEREHCELTDRMTDLLLHKGLTPAERRLVFVCLGQQQALIRAAWDLALTMDQLGADGGVGGALTKFLAASAEYLALQRKATNFEEAQLFPLAVMHFTDADWELLDRVLN